MGNVTNDEKFTTNEGLNDCIDTCCSKNGIDKSVLLEWKDNKSFVQ